MARKTSTKQPAPTAYHLGTPPSRRWISPISVVARGRQSQMRLGARAQFTMSSSNTPTPTESDLPSNSASTHGRALHRTYSFYNGDYNNAAVAGTGLPSNSASNHGRALRRTYSFYDGDYSNAAVAGKNSPEQATTGIVIGKNSFRSLSPADLHIPVFDTPMPFKEFIRLRLQLDSFNGLGGLTLTQFASYIGQCGGCDRYMLARNKDWHECPGKYALPQLVTGRLLLDLLDSTGDGVSGITKSQLKDLFVSCPLCDRVLTHRAALHHNCHVGDSGSSNSEISGSDA